MIQHLKKYTLLFGIFLNLSMLWVMCAAQISVAMEEHVSKSCSIDADCHHKWHINSNYQYQVLFYQISEIPTTPKYSFSIPVKEIIAIELLSTNKNVLQTTLKQTSLRGPPTA